MEKTEVLSKLGYLLDMTKMDQVIWEENAYYGYGISTCGIYSNKTNDVIIGPEGIQFGMFISSDFPELRNRLYIAANKSAIKHDKTLNNIKRD